jgi:hypothetical protein
LIAFGSVIRFFEVLLASIPIPPETTEARMQGILREKASQETAPPILWVSLDRPTALEIKFI